MSIVLGAEKRRYFRGAQGDYLTVVVWAMLTQHPHDIPKMKD